MNPAIFKGKKDFCLNCFKDQPYIVIYVTKDVRVKNAILKNLTLFEAKCKECGTRLIVDEVERENYKIIYKAYELHFKNLVEQFKVALNTFNENKDVVPFENLIYKNNNGVEFPDFINYIFTKGSSSFQISFLEALFNSNINMFVAYYKKALNAAKESSSAPLKQLANEIYDCYKEQFDKVN